MKAKLLILVIASVFAVSLANAQVARTQSGQVLDSSFLVGSGGFNSAVSSRRGVNAQLYVNGQVTGLARFQGDVGYFPANQLRLDLPSAGLSDFRQSSVGIQQIMTGQPYRTSVYLDRSSTILGTRAIAGGFAIPGSSVPKRSTISATQAQGLYKSAVANYSSLIELPPTQGVLASPLIKSSLPEPVKFESSIRSRPTITRPQAASFFSVLKEENREGLARELYEVAQEEQSLDRGLKAGVEAQAHQDFAVIASDRDRKLRKQKEEKMTQDLVPIPDQSLPETQMPESNQDVFFDILTNLQKQREESKATVVELEPRQPVIAPVQEEMEIQAPDTPQEAGEETVDITQLVTLSPDDVVLIRGLAGMSPDAFNRKMAEGERLLKQGKFYDAANTYELAVMLNNKNPLARVGLAFALFSAGEPLTAAMHARTAFRLFPPLMETRFDVNKLLSKEIYKARMSMVVERMKTQEGAIKPEMAFLAAFMSFNAEDFTQAREYAETLMKTETDDKIFRAYSRFILEGKRPNGDDVKEGAAE